MKQESEEKFDEKKDEIMSESLSSSRVAFVPHKRISSTELKKVRKDPPIKSPQKLFKNLILSPP